MKITLDNQAIDLTPTGKSYRLTLGERTYQAEIVRSQAGRLDLRIDGHPTSARVSLDGKRVWVTLAGRTYLLTQSSGAARGTGQNAPGELIAPMPGQVQSVNVAEGEIVKKGQTLLVLVAMKMEIRIQSPLDGVVKRVFVKTGETLEKDKILVEVKSDE
jgi:acetyl/propionyl-CoA carboxylase alpha subunit